MYLIMTQIFSRIMPFTHENKGFVKIYRIVFMAHSPDLNPVDTLYMRAPQQSITLYRTPISNLDDLNDCAPAGRILTNRSSTNLLITGVTS